MITFTGPATAWGLIPAFLSESDPAPACEQFRRNYAHGGGWGPMREWQLTDNDDWRKVTIRYPGDPPLRALGMIVLRTERIFIFPHAWVAIVQPDGRFEVSRMD